MPSIIVEDGTGLANANSYASVASADTYHENRGNGTWADAETADKQVALIRATDYIDLNSFKDTILEDDQSLQFPRYNLENRNGVQVGSTVPVEIEEATFEYALEVLNGGGEMVELDPTPDQSESRALTLERNKVGSIETEQQFDAAAGIKTRKSYPRADRILIASGYLISTGSGLSGRTIR